MYLKRKCVGGVDRKKGGREYEGDNEEGRKRKLGWDEKVILI